MYNPTHSVHGSRQALLNNTFIHIPGIGSVTERELWDAGIHTWHDFLYAQRLPSRARSLRLIASPILEECERRLENMDARYFSENIPRRESWRMYADFRQSAAFLDIETTGMSPHSSIITLVGILDTDGYHSFVHGRNLSDLREALEKYDLIITYNGASFDLPFIERHFGSLFKHKAHIDLRFVLSRLGLKGGLKSIEGRMGVGRPSELSSLDGYDAVRMWRMWTRGDEGALQTLIRYNAEDVISLPKLAEIAYRRIAKSIGAPKRGLVSWTYPEADLPYDSDVILSLRSRL